MNAPTFTSALPRLATRAANANSSIIREILKVTQRPEVISFAGGLPSPATFPVDVLRAAFDAVLRAAGPAALQYGATEGDDALRAWVAARETAKGIPTAFEQVLIVAGSQQGLDLIGKALIDAGSTVLWSNRRFISARCRRLRCCSRSGANCRSTPKGCSPPRSTPHSRAARASPT